jgi:hypothetical protein
MNLAERDTPLQASQSKPRQTSTARRLQKSRQHLGSQRHDLLVAMRVVNSIERETVQAEWEGWLMEENARCEQLGALIRQNTTAMSAGKNHSEQKTLGADFVRLEEVRAWHKEYCDSCSKEQALIGI